MIRILFLITCLHISSAFSRTWYLNVNFIIGLDECRDLNSLECEPVIDWLKEEIRTLHQLYTLNPQIRIRPKFNFLEQINGRSLDILYFNAKHERDFFMRANFSNRYSESGKEGHLTILVVEDIYVGESRSGGSSPLPVKPLKYKGSKRGILVAYRDYSHCKYKSRGTLAHELGHFLGLRHTFDFDPPLNCNSSYPKGPDGMGGTFFDGSVNVLDYRRTDPIEICPRKLFLNNCQKQHLQNYFTVLLDENGQVDYKRLSGIVNTNKKISTIKDDKKELALR